MYAIVDIETTGGYATGHGITEIAIVLSDGSQIIDTFQSLVNPHQQIPPYIQSLTGITNEMVADAPGFALIAPRVAELLEDHVFVAHNVHFDYSFVHHQLMSAGFELRVRKLCTVRTARKIFPDLPSYSLGKLCTQLGIEHRDRHRAGGDATATAHLLHMLIAHDTQGLITKTAFKKSKEKILPPNLPVADFEALPNTPGVYYFHNAKGKIIYIGKAIDLKKRVRSHFSGTKTARQKQEFMRHIHRVSYRECGTELMAIVLESAEIRHHWPEYNRAQKKFEPVLGIYSYQDQLGYTRLGIDKWKKILQPLLPFASIAEAHSHIWTLVNTFALCPRRCGLIKIECDCRHCNERTDPDAYNAAVNDALGHVTDAQQTFLIRGQGRTAAELSCLYIQRGQLYGMGYTPADTDLSAPEAIMPALSPIRDNFYLRRLLHKYAIENPRLVRYYDAESVSAL